MPVFHDGCPRDVVLLAQRNQRFDSSCIRAALPSPMQTVGLRDTRQDERFRHFSEAAGRDGLFETECGLAVAERG